MLEAGSWLILKQSTIKGAVQDDFIFKQVQPNGSFTPTRDYVLPIRENFNLNWVSDEFNVEIRTNSFGLREDFDVELSQINTVFFGDSFTFGHGVEGHERYSYVFASKFKSLEYKIANLSYKNGFQPEHYEFYFKENRELKPRRVIVGLFLGNDLGSDLEETVYDYSSNKLELPYRKILSSGQVGNAPSSYIYPLNKLADKSFFFQFFLKVIQKTSYRSYLFRDGFMGPNSRNTISLEKGETNLFENRAIKSLIRLRGEVEQRGGNLTVVLIPQNFYFGDINPYIDSKLIGELAFIRQRKSLLKNVISVCEKLQFDCFDSSAFLTANSYFTKDGHWNSNGHFSVGVALSNYLK